MSIIQTARYEQFARRLLRLVGPSIMPRLQNDLSPVINIEDPADNALLFWKGHKLAAGSVQAVAGGAGTFSSASLFNPLGSGALFTVLGVQARTAGGNFVIASLSQTRTLNVITTLSFIDTRASLVSVPKGEIGRDAFGAAPAFFWRGAQPSIQEDIFLPVVLSPGVGLFITNATANTAVDANFQWLERSAETPELES